MSDFFRMDVQDVLAELKVDPKIGLTSEEVANRQNQYGKNSLPKAEGANWLQLVINQFSDLMVLILIAAAVISYFVGDPKDVIIIMIIVLLNAVLGIYQEYRAEQALAALSAMQVPMVRVRRNGQVTQISAEELVPGDIVLLEEGDRVSADGRIIESVNLQIEEAALTGESVPVPKNSETIRSTGAVAVGDRTNMAFMGTAVNYGRGELVVTDTGLRTQIGNIATLLLQVEEGTTPLQRRLNQLGRILAAGAGVIVVIVFITGLLRGIPINEMFLTSVSLAVAAVPEGLPALVTIGLSLGAARMVRRNALIRRLPAVETLGSVTVICSDKTGTLTKNEMTATYIALPGHNNVKVSGIGYTPKGEFFHEDGTPLDPHADDAVGRFIKAMALSTNAYLEKSNGNNTMHVVGDTTEGALIVTAQKAGWTREWLEQQLPRVNELPFSSERKAMTTVHKVIGSSLFEGNYISITKGAPDQLVKWATHEHLPTGVVAISDERRQKWLAEIDKMASQGLRVLGLAYRSLDAIPEPLDEQIERELVLLGLVGILDPARPEAREAVKIARDAGIRPIMITGDHALTAEAIARDLGILEEGQRAITGATLDTMDDEQIRAALRQTSCFARVSPAHKLKIVKILQEDNQVVAMTGDGVNDAPALKQADIGVAMGITGTDVSKGASEMVLTDDNFASIVSAVEEGRTIYDNIRKFIKYLLSSNIGEIFVMFIALLVGLKIPLLAIQILWINLVTDGLPAIALGFGKPEPDVMKRKPRPINESVFAGGTGRHILWVGTLMTILTLGGYIWAYTERGMDAFSRTLGLEDFSRAQLVELMGEPVVTAETGDTTTLIPTNWDALNEEERLTVILGEHSSDEARFNEESDEGILGAAERIPRTIAFTILAFVQMFHVAAIHVGERTSFFKIGFSDNPLLLWAILLTFLLQMVVIYVPFMQTAFETFPLRFDELLLCFVFGSVVLFAVEIEKRFLNISSQPMAN